MPTRIALKKPAAEAAPRNSKKILRSQQPKLAASSGALQPATQELPAPQPRSGGSGSATTASTIANPKKRPQRQRHQRPSFRSSILRELHVRSSSKKNTTPNEEAPAAAAAEDNNDIRASPRLLGYIFSMIAAAVMLVSVVQYVWTR